MEQTEKPINTNSPKEASKLWPNNLCVLENEKANPAINCRISKTIITAKAERLSVNKSNKDAKSRSVNNKVFFQNSLIR